LQTHFVDSGFQLISNPVVPSIILLLWRTMAQGLIFLWQTSVYYHTLSSILLTVIVTRIYFFINSSPQPVSGKLETP
jgi:hypothetical protein